MAKGNKNRRRDNVKRTEGRGYGAIDTNEGYTDSGPSSGASRVTGNNGVKDINDRKGNELSLLLEKRGGALGHDVNEDEENEKEEVTIGEVVQGAETGKIGVRDGMDGDFLR